MCWYPVFHSLFKYQYTTTNTKNSEIFLKVDADTSYLIYLHISISFFEPN